MDNTSLKQLQKLVKNNYNPRKCGWTYERSEGNYTDCFSDGEECGASWLAYEVAQIIGIEVEEPEESEEY